MPQVLTLLFAGMVIFCLVVFSKETDGSHFACMKLTNWVITVWLLSGSAYLNADDKT